LANLENSGLIRRERTSNTDKRLVAVQMTEAGHREIEHVFAEQNRLESEWFSALSLGERHQLKTLLDKVSISIADSAKKRN
jgi:DNA-binding MarR family transcriptional regulator